MADIDPIAELRAACDRAGSINRWADFHGLNVSYVAGALRGTCKPGPAILDALGLQRVVTFVRVPKSEQVQDLEQRFPQFLNPKG